MTKLCEECRVALEPKHYENAALFKRRRFCSRDCGRMRGTRNVAAKLDARKVRAIRAGRAKGVPLKKLAERFGVGQSQVSQIANRKQWKHVV